MLTRADNRRRVTRRARARARHATRAGIECLEQRAMLSLAPVLDTFSEADLGELPGPALLGAGPVLGLRPMHRTVVEGGLDADDPGDSVRFHLEVGQVVSLALAAPAGAAGRFALDLLDPSGRVVASRGRAEPEARADADPGEGDLSLAFRAKAAGTYTVSLTGDRAVAESEFHSYALEVRPIGLDPAALSDPSDSTLGTGPGPANLLGASATGSGIIASLAGGRLSLVGPTGYGFEVTGNWTQIVSDAGGGKTNLTFVASAGVNIVSPVGMLPLPVVPGGSFIITTVPNDNGGLFGEVDRTVVTTGYPWLDALATAMAGQFGETYTLPDVGSIDYRQGISLGLALGSTISTTIDVNAPVNPHIPYIYFVASSGVSASFGNFSVSAGAGGGQSRLSIIADPADPSLYIGVATPAAVPIFSGAGIGLSFRGLIPFNPNPVPSQLPQGFTFRGHVYSQLEVNIPAYKVINVNLNGKTVINVDANGDGALIQFLKDNATIRAGGAWAAGQLGAAFVNNAGVFTNLAVAAGASIGVNVALPNVLNATFTMGKATAIYTGTASPSLYFRGEATNNLLSGTLLESFATFLQPGQTFIVDGSASPGQFSASYTAKYAFFGSESTATTTVVGTGLNGANPTLAATIAGTMSLLNVTNAAITGTIDTNGRFQIDGLADVTIAGFTLSSGRFRVTNQGIATFGTLDLGPLGSATVASAATTDGNFILIGNLRTTWGIPFGPSTNANLRLSNAGLAARTTVVFLGQKAGVSGAIQPNLDFSLSGDIRVNFKFSVGGFRVGPSALVHVTLAAAGGVPSLGGDFTLTFGIPGFDFELAMSVFLAYAGLNIPTYSGSGTMSATGPLGTASASVAVTNNAMTVTVLGFGITIPLPF